MQPFLKLVPAVAMHASAAPNLPLELALWLERALGASGVRRKIGRAHV